MAGAKCWFAEPPLRDSSNCLKATAASKSECFLAISSWGCLRIQACGHRKTSCAGLSFEASPHANETSCASDCWYRSDCLTHFVGHGGCFLAVNNHTREESREFDDSVIGPAAAGNRHFSGTLTGCKLEEDKLQEGRPLLEMEHDWA